MRKKLQWKEKDVHTIKTLNNVAVEYFELGLQNISYQIWNGLYCSMQHNAGNDRSLLPIISCNMGNVLRRTGYYEEAYFICIHGLQYCFETGTFCAVPELILQLSDLYLKFGQSEKAELSYSFGIKVFQWIRQEHIYQTIDEMTEQDFLLYCNENAS